MRKIHYHLRKKIKLIKLHDDGDKTVRLGGRDFIATPTRQVFAKISGRIKNKVLNAMPHRVKQHRVRCGEGYTRRSDR